MSAPYSIRDDVSEIIGRMCLISDALQRLSEDINDCTSEDHCMELSDQQRATADQVERWAQEQSHKASELLKALRWVK